MHLRLILSALAGLLSLGLAAGPAAAQSAGVNRTFVSGTGIDNSTCVMPSRPCRTFAYALTQTAAGGTVLAQNAAEYGSMTISQAVSIIGPDGGGAMVTGGINVSTGSADTVILRGLEIVGGDIGLNLNSFGNVYLAESIIRGFGYGIQTFASGNLTITNSTVTDYGDVGIYLGGGGNLVMTGSTVTGSANIGLSANGSSRIVDCTISNFGGTGLSFGGNAFVKGTLLTGNARALTLASFTTVSLDTTTITANGLAIEAINNSLTVNSFGNNNITGNGQAYDPAGFTLTKVPQN